MDEKTDLELRDHADASSGNDALIAASSFTNGHQSTEDQNNICSQLLEAVDAEKTVDTFDVSLQSEGLPQSEQLEPERTRNIGKCNMRKSLAWDAAFFTSAGVLDPDELSCMIKGVDKVGGRHFLPGIEEDISRSTESISTLGSESLTLEGLEADLSEDIRASIQKSSRETNMESLSKAASASKKVGLASKDMMKPKSISKKQNTGMQGPGEPIKQSSGCSQITRSVARNGGPPPSLQKAPKAIGRPNPISSAPKAIGRPSSISSAPLKRASLSANQIKMENDKAKVSSKVASASKVPGLGGSSRTVPRPALSSKSSSCGSSLAAKRQPVKVSSSSDSSGSVSSSNIGASSATRRKHDSRTVNPTSSSSSLKKPSKVALKKKGPYGVSACLKPSKLPSNISPASSISEWSSESSSSTATVNQKSHTSRASITSSPHGLLDNDAPVAVVHLNLSNDQISKTRGNKETQPPSQNVKAALTHEISQAATVKPTCLRMPSPKIGFFDGAKPVIRTPNRSMQSSSGIPAGARVGSSICGPSGVSKISKLSKMKVDSQKPASSVPSTRKVSSTSGGVKSSLSVPLEFQNKTDGESRLKAKEVELKRPDKVNDVPDSGVDAEKTGRSIGVLKSEKNLEEQNNIGLEDVKVASVEGESHTSTSDCDAGNMIYNEVGEDKMCGSNHPTKKWHSLYESNEKENAYIENQGEILSMLAQAENSKQELQKELDYNPTSQIDSSHPESYNPTSQIDSSHPESGQKEGSASNLLGPTAISVSPVNSDTTASTRSPLNNKNSLSNDEGFELPVRSSIRPVGTT